MNIIIVMLGIAMISIYSKTAEDILIFYLYPEQNNPKFKLLNINLENILAIFLIKISISLIIVNIIPMSDTFIDVGEEIKEILPFIIWIIIAEDLVFRVIPWGIVFYLRTKKRTVFYEKMNIAVAIISALIISGLHITNYENPIFVDYFRLSSQFFGALLYWYLIEKEGIFAPILVHLAFDFLIFLPILI